MEKIFVGFTGLSVEAQNDFYVFQPFLTASKASLFNLITTTSSSSFISIKFPFYLTTLSLFPLSASTSPADMSVYWLSIALHFS